MAVVVLQGDIRVPLVLVVDDGEEARDLYCAYLEFHGLRAQAAEDGISGLGMAEANAPDVVVLDFSMPKMDGVEVLHRLKAQELTRLIPVVMLTAMPQLVSSSTREECDAFLQKPCDPDQLLRTILRLVRRRRSARRAAMRRAAE
jgi:CheY-like chemotaxis protein